MNRVFSAAVVAMSAGVACAQFGAYPIDTELRFEVFDNGQWTRAMRAAPGQQVEWRAVVSYVGPGTGVFALGGLLYQPMISNADNDGAGAQADQVVDLIRDSGLGIPGSLLSQADGESGAPRPTNDTVTDNIGYGRVDFGQTGMSGATSGLTAHRHSGGSNGAPPGEWIRLAGAVAMDWPVIWSGPCPIATCPDISDIRLGVSAHQPSLALAGTNHVAGAAGMKVFRGALRLSDRENARLLTISSRAEAVNREGNFGGGDDVRFMDWQLNVTDFGSYKCGVRFKAARIFVNMEPTDVLLDFDMDGSEAQTSDLMAFLQVFGGGECPAAQCGEIDVNGDGVWPDVVDLMEFLEVFGAA